MRLLKTELNSRGHEICTFKAGKKDLQLSLSLCEQARRHMPRTEETVSAYNRIGSICRCFKDLVK